jgi:hypothetical protein
MQQQIVTTARTWLGTRFHHQGRVKKSENSQGGVDCLGLLIGVASERGLPLAKLDETSYSHHPNTDKLQQILAENMQEIAIPQIQEGDILLLSIDSHPQHLAIVSNFTNGLGIIHAYAPARKVVEHSLDSWWCERIVAAFRIAE